MAPIVVAPESLRFAEARARVIEAVRPLPAEEEALGGLRGRALRRTVIASGDLPPFRNASMDGIALASADWRANAALEIPIAGTIAAGIAPAGPLESGRGAWIMTGAMLPGRADAVIPIEDLEALDGASPAHPGGRVRTIARPVPGLNVREAGADLKRGETALEEGGEISAHDVALLAALGETRAMAGPRPRVAILSTGDELLAPGEPPRPGAIRDSNGPLLAALLDEAGARVISTERAGDDPADVAARIRRALATADATITVGGVSQGAFDPVKAAIADIGGIALWRVAMKPGRPQAFGAPGGRLFFGLPGNPASVACVFEVLVRPALRRLQGFLAIDRPRLSARAAARIDSRVGRTDFVRVTLESRAGEWWAREAGAQISGHLTPQSRAHGLLIVPEEVARLAAGDPAETLVWRWPLQA